MAENDEASGGDIADTPYVPTGPRRSTFTPPSGKYPPLFDKGEDAVETAAAEVPAAEATEAAAVGSHEDVAGMPAPATTGRPDSGHEAPAPEQPSVQPNEVATPTGELPERPRRQSLQDDELLRALSPDVQESTGTLATIEHLQAELELRQREAQEFSQWEERMRAIGTPEALESIAEAIPEFTGVIPIIPPQPAPEPFLDPEQFPPPRFEERVDVGPLAEPNLSDHLVFLPPWMTDTPAEATASTEPALSVEPAPSVEPVPLVESALPEEPLSEEPLPSKPAPSDLPNSDAAALNDAATSDVPVTSDISAIADEAAPSDGAVTMIPEASETPEAFDGSVLYDLVDPISPDRTALPQTDADAAESSQTVFPGESEAEASAESEAEQPATPEAEVPATSEAEVSVVPEPEAPAEALLESGPTPVPEAQPALSPFDALLAGDPEATSNDTDARPFSLLDTPLDSEPTPTGSQAIIIPVVEDELDDDVDETDRAFGDPSGAYPVDAEGVTTVPPTTGSAPIQPVATPRIPTSEQIILDAEPAKTPLFSLELSTTEATPVEQRVGRAARMFWLWFATNSSLVSVAFGAALFGLGMSLRQAILAVFIGVAISFLPLGLGTLAGKWSGQPTIVVSRATFGLVGNIVPAILTLVVRLFWGAVLLWLVAVCTARILTGASLGGPFDETQLAFLSAGVGFALALVVALFGYHLFARLQLILSVASAILIVGLLAVTWHEVNIRTALTVGDGPWILVVTGVVLVFSFIGLVWANSSGDIARYQRPAGSGAAASLWASFGATLPAFLLISYGALLAASNPDTAAGLLARPLDTIALMIPTWYPVPLVAATVLSLLSGVALSIYSGGFALSAVGLRLSRPWTVVASGVVLFAITVAVVLSNAGIADVFRDIATSLAVPVAAWAGIFAAEVMIRRKRFDEASLLAPGGIYPAVNWVNLVMLFVASAIGFAFTTASVSWLSWQGYGFALFGFPLHGEIAASDLGVLVALALGILTPLAAGVSTVRHQESMGR